MNSETKTKTNPWVLLIIILLACAVAPATLFKVSPIMSNLMTELNLNATEVGLLSSSFAIPGIILAIPAGVIVAKFGNWYSGLIAFGSIVLAGIVGAFSGSLTPLVVSRIIEGIGMVFISLVGPAAVSQLFPPSQRGRAMGLFTTYMSVGQIIVFNLAPRIAVPFGWKGVWWFTAIYAAIFGLLWLVLRRQIGGNAAAPSESREQKEHLTIGAVIKSRDVWAVTILFGLFMVSFEGVLIFLTTYLTAVRGMEAAAASSLTSIVGIVGVAGSIIGGMVSDKLKTRKWVMLAGMIICGAAYFLIPSVPTGIFVVMIIVLGFFPNAVPPVAFSGATEVVAPKLAGLAVALVALGQNVGLFFSTTIFGYFVDKTGWQAAFTFCAAISVVGGLAILAAKKLK